MAKSSPSTDTRRRRSSLQSIDDFLVQLSPEAETKADSNVKVKVVSGRGAESAAAESSSRERFVLVNLVPPDKPSGTQRMACDIACAIDISGSMGGEATITGSGGARESHGLSLLDVAKHGVRTIIHTLGESDRLALIAFDHQCQTIFDLMPMDAAGRDLADKKLDALVPRGGTDIWLGVEGALNALRAGRITEDGTGRGCFAHLMLLTDGKTLYREKIMPKFSEFKEKSDFMPTTIGTFGFGYNIDSDLLCDLAREGNGSYAFIPDAGFVGTAFVNAVSNMLTTVAREVRLSLKAQPGAEIVEVVGYQVKKAPEPESLAFGPRRSIATWLGTRQVTKEESSTEVSLGTLQFGQTTDVVVRMEMPEDPDAPYLTASLHYELEYDGQWVEIEPTHGEHTSTEEEKIEVEVQRCRCCFVEALRKALAAAEEKSDEGLTSAQRIMQELSVEVKASPAASTERVQALLEDIGGQSTEALSRRDWYQKWGVHYLPSLMFAHRMQQCNNFKDPGVQFYGGDLFESIRDDADEEFNSLPAPKPSRPVSHAGYGGGGGRASAAPVSMAAYNDASAG